MASGCGSSGCSDGSDSTGSGTGEAVASPVAARTTAAADRLTAEGAEAALITESDIEDDWTQSDDAADWHESLLVGKVDVADFLSAKSDASDCQQLLDGLYDDDLLGKPAGASALRGFQEGDSRLLYQVAAYEQSDLDSSLAWLKTLPVECDRFTATDGEGEKRTVEVIETSVPDEGDARQGLRVTVQGDVDGSPATLTLDVAAVRVGSDGITVTSGGLDGDEDDSVEDAVEAGVPRLKDVQAGKTPQS
ncbi:hypothetical protein [Streptomyces sp. NPDC003832]